MAVSPETWSKMKETRHRLENCWKMDLNWSLYPETLKQVSMQFFLVLLKVIVSPSANWIDNMLLVLLVYCRTVFTCLCTTWLAPGNNCN